MFPQFSLVNMCNFEFFKENMFLKFNKYLMDVHCVLDTMRVQDECAMPSVIPRTASSSGRIRCASCENSLK